ncbi:MAG: hypothetical protein FD170_3011 [Bacteroidetes bacterium]|nr:MAG: hypothetical protein FD170_3011 [Bacteroidota bacterium]
MKKRLLTLGIFVFGFLSGFGQKLHTPAEIIKIMEESRILYELEILEEEILPEDRTNNLNYNFYYRVIDDSSISTYEYKIDSSAYVYVEKAEKYFQDKKFSLAREMYLAALKEDSSYYKVMTYIGQTYGIEGDFDKAIEWYNKTINLNYIDYMAHWFLADAYKTQGEIDKAVDEITLAMILNRNNARIKNSFNTIYKLKKLNADDWTFNPQMIIDSVGIDKVKISFNENWLGYAMAKAVWRYEPGYKESMGIKDGSFSTTEVRECLLGLMVSFDKKKLKKFPEFKALDMAVEKDLVNEFILYEIILPEHPFVAYQLSEEFLNSIKDYVKEVRGKQK